MRIRTAIAAALPIPLLVWQAVSPASAADFTNGVPRELIQVFTGGYVTEGLPANFPPVTLPAGMAVVGGLDRGFNQMVIFSATGELPAAGTALETALITSGWRRLPDIVFEQQQTGFVAPSSQRPPTVAAELCRDDAGTLNINVPADGSWLTMNVNLNASMEPAFSCDTRAQQREQAGSRQRSMDPMTTMVQRFMPKLELPAVTAANPFPPPAIFGGRGFSGSAGDIETTANLRVALNTAQLLEHFAGQLSAQGWNQDAAVSGELTAHSSWTREEVGNQLLVGMLSIVKLGDDNYVLKFRLLLRQPSQPAANNRFFRGN